MAGAENSGSAAELARAESECHPASGEAETVARQYFDAINRRDLDGAVAMWAAAS